jgi:hypothetical protein
MERPTRQTRRLAEAAARTALSMRATLEAKQATATLPVSLGSSSVRGLADQPLGAGVAFHEDVGAVADHGQHALVPQAAERVGVGHLARDGVGIDLPVAGVQHDAVRGADRQPVGLGDGVGERDQVDLEGAQVDPAAQRDLMDLEALHAGVVELLAHEKRREGRGVDRRLEQRPQPRQAADMVLVGVGDDDAQDVGRVLLEEGGVRGDDVHAGRGQVAEGHAHIHHDPLAIVGGP